MYSCGDIFKHCHISTCGEEEQEKKSWLLPSEIMSLSIFLPYTCTLLLKKSLGKDHLLLAGLRPAFPFLNRLGRLSPLSSECESGSKKIFFLCVLVFLHSCSLVVKEPKIFDTTLCCSVPPTLKKKGLRTNSGVCWCYYYCCSSVC